VGAVREIMGVERVVDVACVCMMHVVCSGKGKREKKVERYYRRGATFFGTPSVAYYRWLTKKVVRQRYVGIPHTIWSTLIHGVQHAGTTTVNSTRVPLIWCIYVIKSSISLFLQLWRPRP
jgi:hypothetical protein